MENRNQKLTGICYFSNGCMRTSACFHRAHALLGKSLVSNQEFPVFSEKGLLDYFHSFSKLIDLKKIQNNTVGGFLNIFVASVSVNIIFVPSWNFAEIYLTPPVCFAKPILFRKAWFSSVISLFLSLYLRKKVFFQNITFLLGILPCENIIGDHAYVVSLT